MEGPSVSGPGGATLATWDLGGDGAPVLVIHATGFHGRCYRPLASEAPTLHWWGIDLAGHGASDPYPDGDYSWGRLRDDVGAAIAALELERPWVVGHSLGGALALMVEAAAPGTFSGMLLWEPIVLGPGLMPAGGHRDLSEMARRRRPRFPSLAAALANYAAKAPFAFMRADALLEYVDGGFRPAAGGGVALACSPETEARVYEATLAAGLADQLPLVDVAVALACGAVAPDIDPHHLRAIADRMPRADVTVHPALGHFGPLENPRWVAAEAVRRFTPGA
jgi:pimeloyl-ACP methyl ester carboxylesterase